MTASCLADRLASPSPPEREPTDVRPQLAVEGAVACRGTLDPRVPRSPVDLLDQTMGEAAPGTGGRIEPDLDERGLGDADQDAARDRRQGPLRSPAPDPDGSS